MRHFLILVVATATTAFPTRFSFAQGAANYPTRPVRVIVAVAPGGGTDLLARMLSQKLSETLKRQFVVENRAGGGNAIGYGFVAESAPDGYTLLAATPSLTFGPALRPDFPDPIKGFAPISLVASFPFMLLMHPSLPVKSVKELIALARAKPGALDWGVSSGSFSHLVAAYFVSAADIKVTFIPYKGTGQVLIDAIAGRVQAFFGNVLSYLPQVKSGRLRALAVSSAERSSALPELPTISESGVRGYDVSGWHGWVAPAGTPTAIVSKLSAEFAKAVRSPDVAKTLVRDGGNPIGSTPDQFRQLIAAEVPRWRKVVKDSRMRVE